jgi:hypothetical protein
VLRTAGLEVAATAGAVVGFGVRRGAPGAVLSAAGDRLRGVPAFVAPDRAFGTSAALGLAHHVALSLAWGVAAVLLARDLSAGPRTMVVAVVASLAVTVDRVLPASLCLLAGVASAPQRVLLALVFAGALLAGMRLAQHDRARSTLMSVGPTSDTLERDHS